MPRKHGHESGQARVIQPGDSGIFATCIKGKEAKCIGELRDLFDEYAGLLYGEAFAGVAAPDAEADEDIEKSIAAEIASIRKPSTARLFTPVNISLQCGKLLSRNWLATPMC